MHAEALREATEANLVTKSDLREAAGTLQEQIAATKADLRDAVTPLDARLGSIESRLDGLATKKELAELETRLTRLLLYQGAAVATLVVTLVKLL